MPVIAAITGDNTKLPDIANKISAADFDLVFETPASIENFKKSLLPFIRERRAIFQDHISFLLLHEEFHRSVISQSEN